MEALMKPQRYHQTTTTTTSPPPSMHKNSHVISKFRPKIRIVHIFAPKIIKTDVENFRELVQRLTGKPSPEEKPQKKREEKLMKKNEEGEQYGGYQSCWGCDESMMMKNEEEIMWGGESNSSCFYNGFGDLDGFIHGITEFPLVDVFEGACFT